MQQRGECTHPAAERWHSCNWFCAVDWFVINDVRLSLPGGLEPDTQSGETFNLWTSWSDIRPPHVHTGGICHTES